MIIHRAKSAGFCFGVSHALRLLDKELVERDSSQRVITLGPIIHNPLVMQEYAEQGVECIEDIDDVRAGDTVIIRAHGIPISTEKKLKDLGATLIDATCPKVKQAQLAIAEQSEEGKYLLLFGETDHPEVKGLISYAGDDVFVFSSLEELASFPFSFEKVYFLAAQTTQDKELFLKSEAFLAEKLGYKPLALNTICDATKKRQEETIAIAKDVQCMIVVGGKNSGNTRRLADVAIAQGIPSIHVESIHDLNKEDLQNVTVVGLTAGASTPTKYVDEIESFLQSCS